MSTRSGKRIHSSNDEDVVVENSEFKNVIKTRSKRQKENLPEATPKHYVRYPSDENLTNNVPVEVIVKSTRKSKKHTLKEQNITTDSETLQNDDRGEVRSTRRTKKFDVPEDLNIIENLTTNFPIEVMVKSTRKSKKHALKEHNVMADSEPSQHEDKGEVRSTRRTKKFDVPEDLNVVESNQGKEAVGKKKNKKKKVKSPFKEENIENESKPVILNNKKKSNTKKNKRSKSNSFVVEEVIDNKIVNKSNVTNDSFHSAAGSPINMDSEEKSIKHFIPKKLKVKKIKADVSHDDKRQTDSETDTDNIEVKCPIMDMDCNNDHLKNSLNKDVVDVLNNVKAHVDEVDNTTFEKDKTLTDLNKSLGSSSKKRKSMRKISGCNMEEINGLIHIDNENKVFNSSGNNVKLNGGSPSLNKTFDSIFNNKKSKNSIISDNVTALNITFEKDNSNKISNESITGINNITYSGSKKRKSSLKNSTYDKIDSSIINLNSTYEKEPVTNNKSIPNNTINESLKSTTRQSSKHSLGEAVTSLNSTYNKNGKTSGSSSVNTTFDQTKLDTTFDKSSKRNSIEKISPKAKSSLISSDTTDNCTSDFTDDNSRISITSDDSKAENIINTTPVLIESSMDESVVASDGKNIEIVPLKRQNTFTDTEVIPPPLRREGTYTEMDPKKQFNNNVITTEEFKSPPLIREGTFNTVETDLQSEIETTSPTNKSSSLNSTTPLKNNINKTPLKISTKTTPAKRKSSSTKDDVPTTPKMKSNEKIQRRKSLPSPGHTPFPPSKSSSKENNILNVTCTIEKSRRSSVADLAPRMTRVMFCSPVNNPAVVTQMKGKVIKSNLKGSNKSFVFDESVSELSRSGRKRSYTQSAAEDARSERERRAHQHSVERLSRARTASASARLQVDTPTKSTQKLPGAKAEPRRTKLPNFAALHQKQFQRMESLDECQQRRAKRARRLLTPTGAAATRTSPKETQQDVKQPDTTNKKAETPKSKKSDAKPAYTRFGFKLNLDFNPFSIPAKNTESKPKENRPKDHIRQPTLPSLAGTTLRREIAKQTIMREKSFTEKHNVNRSDYRTYLKGVRTNRRFDMQMKMRNIRDK